MRHTPPRCPEAVVGLPNRVHPEESKKLFFTISNAVLVPLVDRIGPLKEIGEWDQRVSILLNLVDQLVLGLLEASPSQH